MNSILESILAFASRTDFLAIWFDAAFKVTLLLGVAGLVVLAARRAGAAVRHLVWTLALAGALVVPILSWTLPDWQVPFVPRMASRPGFQAVPVRVVETSPSARGFVMFSQSSGSPATNAAGIPQFTGIIPDTPNGDLQSESKPAAPPVRFEIRPTLGLGIALIWLAGAGLVIATLLIGMASIRRLRRGATVLAADAALPRLARELCSQLHLRRCVTLLRSGGLAMPMTWGWMRPVVLLPSDADAWPEARRRAVLLHELAHVKRHDYLVQCMAQIACGVYWFHPLVWLAAARLRVERERACDDQVLCTGSKASEYASQLLEMARSLRPATPRLVPTVAMAHPSQLGARLRAILDDKSRRTVLDRRLAVLAFIACSLISVPLAAIGPKVARRDIPTKRTPPAKLAPSQDVRSHAVRMNDHDSRPASAACVAIEAHGKTPSCAVAVKSGHAAAATQSHPAAATQSYPAAVAEAHAAGSPEAYAAALALAADFAAADVDAKGKKRSRTTSTSTSTSSDTHSSSNSHSSTHIEDDGDLQLSFSSDGITIKAKAKGEVKFNAAETDVESVSRGGSFEIDERAGGERHRLEITSGQSGLVREYWVNGNRREFDAEGRRWLAASLERLFMGTGYGADRRAQRLFEREGADGVMRQVHDIGTDYAQRIYLIAVIETGKLDGPTVERVLRLAGQEIESDYDLTQVMLAVNKSYPLDKNTVDAYVETAGKIDSDYSRRQALAAVFAMDRPLDPAATEAILGMAKSIDSDYELAQLLLQVIQAQPTDRELTPAFLQATEGLDSAYHHRQVLTAVVERHPLPKSVLLSILQSAAKIDSEYDRAELLVLLVEKHGLDAELRPAFMSAAKSLDSQYERGRVLTAAADHGL